MLHFLSQLFCHEQDLDECQFVVDYIGGKHNAEEFFARFHPNAMSKGFDPDADLQSIGIANQTTMLKVRTREAVPVLSTV